MKSIVARLGVSDAQSREFTEAILYLAFVACFWKQ
jgi:hypothetical protein